MSLVRHWLSRAAPERPALILPDGATFTFRDLSQRAGGTGLNVLQGDAGTLALGLIDCALGDGTAFPLPPGLHPTQRESLLALAAGATDPRLSLIITTSGSTGQPKGVRLSWRAVAAAARIGGKALDLRPNDVWLICLPLYLIGGATILYRTLRAGATALVHEGFDAVAVGEALAAHGVTHVSLVPAMLAQLVERAVPPAPSLRCALIGGQALAPALAEKARAAGWPLRLSYGMSETCATALVDGRPLPGVRVRVGAAGTLEVASPARMRGYLGEEDAGEWLTTNDLAAIADDGRVTILGRADEMLISGGVKVHPLEIEARLAGCPGVRDAGVIGLPDPVWGDVIACAYEGHASEREVDAWCRASLPSARRPRRFMRLERLPRLPSGKLDRRALRGLWS